MVVESTISLVLQKCFISVMLLFHLSPSLICLNDEIIVIYAQRQFQIG